MRDPIKVCGVVDELGWEIERPGRVSPRETSQAFKNERDTQTPLAASAPGVNDRVTFPKLLPGVIRPKG